MNTKNPRINVTFENTSAILLMQLAQNEHKSVASLVRELTLEALELREDYTLSQLADDLDVSNTRLYTHSDAWK